MLPPDDQLEHQPALILRRAPRLLPQLSDNSSVRSLGHPEEEEDSPIAVLEASGLEDADGSLHCRAVDPHDGQLDLADTSGRSAHNSTMVEWATLSQSQRGPIVPWSRPGACGCQMLRPKDLGACGCQAPVAAAPNHVSS